MKIGYARVSREDQNIALQHDALKAAGCGKIFDDKKTGATMTRPGLERALAHLRPGDELVVWKFDRLGRTMLETLTLAIDLDRRGIAFRSLNESFDTATPIGRGVMAIIAAVAEDERAGLIKRTRGHGGGEATGRADRTAAKARRSTDRAHASFYCQRDGNSSSGRHAAARRRDDAGAGAQGGRENSDEGPNRDSYAVQLTPTAGTFPDSRSLGGPWTIALRSPPICRAGPAPPATSAQIVVRGGLRC
jgi:hypothetical protein